MGEPTFAVPLSALVRIGSAGQRRTWTCLFADAFSDDGWCEHETVPSQAEAESAAIAHLADVHGLTVAAEELNETPALRLTRRSIQQHLKERLLTVVEWLEMATTDPTVPSCVIQFDLDRHGLELRAIYEDLEVGFR